VLVTEPSAGQVTVLEDTDGDGTSDNKRILTSRLPDVHGIARHGNILYMATPQAIYTGILQPDHTLSNLRKLVSGLPPGGAHPYRGLAFGPDGKLYVSIGSTCNACIERDPESATILQIEPNGKSRRIFTSGLRSTIGFDWHPETKDMWGMDAGTNWIDPDLPPEELNHLIDGGHYGWPWCYGDGQIDVKMKPNPPGKTPQAYCSHTIPSELKYQPHSSPMGMLFYTGQQFPEEYRNDAFVAMHGSWNRIPAVGFKVVRIRFQDGKPLAMEDFLTGFLLDNTKAQFGTPAGLAVTPNGTLLISDDGNGVIYRVNYQTPKPKRTTH
jgi:glucose/arabinose dehydrogenase